MPSPAASVATSNLSRAHRLTEQIHAGTVTVNGVDAFSAWTPFGGFKKSGLGRELGVLATTDKEALYAALFFASMTVHLFAAFFCVCFSALMAVLIQKRALAALGDRLIGGQLIVNPTEQQVAESDLDGLDYRILDILANDARIPLTRFSTGTQRGIRERRARWFEVAGDPEHIGIADYHIDKLLPEVNPSMIPIQHYPMIS